MSCSPNMQTYDFHKTEVPDDEEGKAQLAQKLNKYKVSLLEYIRSINTRYDLNDNTG